MFTPNQRVRHLASNMLGSVILQRLNMEEKREEIRVLFDDQSQISDWAPASEFGSA